MVSMETLLAKKVPMRDARRVMISHMQDLFHARFKKIPLEELRKQLAAMQKNSGKGAAP